MTALRQRMIEDLRLRGFADRTVEAYVSAVARLARFHHASPDRLTEEHLRAYLLHLTTERRLTGSSFTVALCGLRFFYEQTLKRRWAILDAARPKRAKKLPVVLSRDEVWRVLAAVRTPAYRVCLTTIYACGLRLVEGISLHVADVDSGRSLLHIRQGKGGIDRRVPLPEAALGFKGYPLATLAFYGPDNARASKVVVGIVHREKEDVRELEKWLSDVSDVREDEAIGHQVLAFIQKHGVRTVVTGPGIRPHEEGIDYLDGSACPKCPYWAGRERPI